MPGNDEITIIRSKKKRSDEESESVEKGRQKLQVNAAKNNIVT